MVACFRPSLSWTYVIELVFMNHDKTLAVKLAPNVGPEALKITYGMIINWKA